MAATSTGVVARSITAHEKASSRMLATVATLDAAGVAVTLRLVHDVTERCNHVWHPELFQGLIDRGLIAEFPGQDHHGQKAYGITLEGLENLRQLVLCGASGGIAQGAMDMVRGLILGTSSHLLSPKGAGTRA